MNKVSGVEISPERLTRLGEVEAGKGSGRG